MADKNKTGSYKKLVSNTIIFALGSFSSKVLVLFLVPIYTNYLTTEQLGQTDLVVQVANWLIPIFSLTVYEAMIRFGLDKATDKRQVFSIGNLVVFSGLAAMCLIMPLVKLTGILDKYIGEYTLLLCIYVCTASLRWVYSSFVRSLEMVRLFALDGLLATFMTLLWTALLIIGFKMDVKGYILAIILSDLCSFLFLTFAARLWRYIEFKRVDRELLNSILRYSIPMIPAQVLWLLTNTCDSFMSASYLGKGSTGILSAAYKIPNIVSSIYLMFGQAWNMSAITENDSEDRSEFYQNVFDANQTLMYCLAGGCLIFVRLITKLWIGADFQDAKLYSPILIYSMIYICFTTFLGSVYVATKKTKKTMYTSLLAGIINIGINIIFLKRFGLYATAVSTVCGYGAVFIVRAIDAKKLVGFRFNKVIFFGSNIVLVLMVLANYISRTGLRYITLFGLYLVLILINYKAIKGMLERILGAVLGRLKRKPQQSGQ
ncbi:MAG: lipopolysaccharide biosynthesis protein [Ruminococcus sp.]|nr:lipopolysaccharide biosynthesis protein [Ruminococcus sp.]